MHYYTFNVGDYRKDTGHLTTLEHGIYRQLIDWYYLDEAPIPKETQVVIRRLRLGSDSDMKSLQNVLDDFFVLQDDGYHQGHCDAVIAKYHEKADKNKTNGKLGGRPKKTQSVILGNPNETQTKGNQEPITNNHKPIKNTGASAPIVLRPDFIDEQLWNDWLIVRKKKSAPLTPTAWAMMTNQVEKAGWTLEKAIQECCLRTWATFRADWLSNGDKTEQPKKVKWS